MKEQIIKAVCFIVAGVAFAVFFMNVFQSHSKAFDFGLDSTLSNPSYYDGYGEMSTYVRYGIFKDLRECYGDLQATKILESIESKQESLSVLDSMIEACKVMKKETKEQK